MSIELDNTKFTYWLVDARGVAIPRQMEVGMEVGDRVFFNLVARSLDELAARADLIEACGTKACGSCGLHVCAGCETVPAEVLHNTIHNAVEHMKNLAHRWESQAAKFEVGSTTAVYLVTFANELRNHADSFKTSQPGGHE